MTTMFHNQPMQLRCSGEQEAWSSATVLVTQCKQGAEDTWEDTRQQVSGAPFHAPYCMQAAANAATMAALRRANASVAQAHPQKDASISHMADCMHTLSCWRDKRARKVDEGTSPAHADVPMLGASPDRKSCRTALATVESSRGGCSKAEALASGQSG